jgi:hypothetical protein
VQGFYLRHVELLLHDPATMAQVQHRLNNVRDTAPGALPELEAVRRDVEATPEGRDIIHALKGLFVTHHPKPKANFLHVFHGTRIDCINGIIQRGLLRLTREDQGYFGSGCYTTPSIEYAARYASGELSTQGPRPTDARGCWPVVMFASVVGLAFPVVRSQSYLPGQPYSKYFGKPLRSGVVDAHFVPVNARHQWQACPVAEAEYFELVSDNAASLVPIAVLWLSK